MRRSAVSRLRWFALGALGLLVLAEPIGCGAILGIQDPTLVDAGTDATGGGEASVVDSAPDHTVVEAGEAEASEDTGLDVVEAGFSCEAGTTLCIPGADGGLAADGGGDAGVGAPYCADLTSDPGNCNACGAACPVGKDRNGVATNSPTCTAGACGLGTCTTNYADCNNDPSDGCEVNLQTDSLNCGVCGTQCPNTAPVCNMGACGLNCPAATPTICRLGPDGGFIDSGTGPAYCTNTNMDAANCGGCGNTCAVNHNTPTCNGACQIGTCDQGFADCNNDPSDGCEVNLQTDPTHCGSCSNACSVANATTTCNGGTCGIMQCAAGHGDCNGSYTDGCEVDLTTDNNNCGACTTVCATQCSANVATSSCSAGSCKIDTCSPNYYNIDGICGDGCECLQSTLATCAAPGIISLSGPGTSQNVTGNLIPDATTETWYQVAFAGNKVANYHPHVVFMTNPGEEYLFDIETNCTGGNETCAEKIDAGADAGAPQHSTGLTEWEEFYAPGVDLVDASFVAIPSVGTIYIHVYRAPGAAIDCNNYTLTVSN
jgi:hypothetical protein